MARYEVVLKEATNDMLMQKAREVRITLLEQGLVSPELSQDPKVLRAIASALKEAVNDIRPVKGATEVFFDQLFGIHRKYRFLFGMLVMVWYSVFLFTADKPEMGGAGIFTAFCLMLGFFATCDKP